MAISAGAKFKRILRKMDHSVWLSRVNYTGYPLLVTTGESIKTYIVAMPSCRRCLIVGLYFALVFSLGFLRRTLSRAALITIYKTFVGIHLITVIFFLTKHLIFHSTKNQNPLNTSLALLTETVMGDSRENLFEKSCLESLQHQCY